MSPNILPSDNIRVVADAFVGLVYMVGGVPNQNQTPPTLLHRLSSRDHLRGHHVVPGFPRAPAFIRPPDDPLAAQTNREG